MDTGASLCGKDSQKTLYETRVVGGIGLYLSIYLIDVIGLRILPLRAIPHITLEEFSVVESTLASSWPTLRSLVK